MEQDALLVTGLFDTRKTSVVVETADVLEKCGVPYAALEVLDRLGWREVRAETTGHSSRRATMGA